MDEKKDVEMKFFEERQRDVEIDIKGILEEKRFNASCEKDDTDQAILHWAITEGATEGNEVAG